MLLLFAVLCLVPDVSADDERTISRDRLPLKARQFIEEFYPEVKVAYAKREREFFEVEYEVMLTNGVKMKFLRNGQWKQIDCRYGQLPMNVVPAPIARKIEELHPGAVITGIERDRRDIDVILDNRRELTFSRKYDLVNTHD